MIPHPTIPNFFIIPDYAAFQSIFFNAYEPVVRHIASDGKIIDMIDKEKLLKSEYTMLKTEK